MKTKGIKLTYFPETEMLQMSASQQIKDFSLVLFFLVFVFFLTLRFSQDLCYMETMEVT